MQNGKKVPKAVYCYEKKIVFCLVLSSNQFELCVQSHKIGFDWLYCVSCLNCFSALNIRSICVNIRISAKWSSDDNVWTMVNCSNVLLIEGFCFDYFAYCYDIRICVPYSVSSNYLSIVGINIK